MDETEAREILTAHKIEIGPDDPRSVVQVATALVNTGSPMLRQVVHLLETENKT